MPQEPRDHRIPLQAAAALTRRFRQGVPKGAVVAELIGKKALLELLSQPGCEGLRIYLAQKESGVNAMVLVGTDSADNDLTAGTILQELFPCPPYCPKGSPLHG